MIKLLTFLKIIPIIILFQLGCSVKNDTRYDGIEPRFTNSPQKTTDPHLKDLEEIYNNMDYRKVISKYLHYILFNASVTRFRYYVIFSALDENTTYNLIDKDIRYTVDAMTDNYLSDFPDSVTPVFFFNDYDSYRDFAVNTFGIDEDDLSPFGFYKTSKNAVVIKYNSWKGSTSHEITHSLIQHDFPDVPSWFNEGLASLHEKYIYKDGKMIGDFSWRIIALRRAFSENTYTGLKTLMKTNDDELYGKRTSFYYAQSRYLLMYLQQKGLLIDYYKTFRETYNEDETGISQLEKITGKPLRKIDKELIDYINSFELKW
jgi:hypothetical protein